MYKWLIILTLFLFTSCKKHHVVSPAFYYWKSGFNISNVEKNYLDSVGVHKLYVKFFDVGWNDKAHEALPEAIISFNSDIPSGLELIPVVYITNKTLTNTPENKITTLAERIRLMLLGILNNKNIRPKEIQFDCDWTDNTREKYFSLLTYIKQYTDSNKIDLTATIRLHQVKYYKITGIPPVKRGMLMFYNMGDLSNAQTVNSIFNKTDAEKYISSVSAYPLPLDAALPAFSWGIHLHQGKISSLVNNLSATDFEQSGYFSKTGAHTYRADSSFFFHGDYFFQNDLVKVEEISPDICLQAATLLSPHLSNDSLTVSLFHLDNSIISRYERKKTEAVYNTFR